LSTTPLVRTGADNPGRDGDGDVSSRAHGGALVLLTRAGCGLCEEMHAALLALSARTPLPLVTLVDIDTDSRLQRRWGLKIPVLLLDGTPVCHARLDSQALIRALADAARADGVRAVASPAEPRR